MKKSKMDPKRIEELKETQKWLKASMYLSGSGYFEEPTNITPEEHRQILGTSNRKPISIRIPEDDLVEIQKIAKANGRKYQQLIVQAFQLYIDNYHRLKKTKKL
jgi:hypothetical protein